MTIAMKRALRKGDVAGFMHAAQTFFAQIPYDVQGVSSEYEGYYQTIIYCMLVLTGFQATVEEKTNEGRIDMTVQTDHHVYIMEFKLNGTKEEALQQIKDRHYAQKYQSSGKDITLIAVQFSKELRNIPEDGWISEVVA